MIPFFALECAFYHSATIILGNAFCGKSLHPPLDVSFIVNVVLNRDGGVVAMVAGDVVAAHRAGVEIARPIYTVELDEQTDIVVAGSHPSDRDLCQGFKPINNCGTLVKDSGTLILVILAPQSIAPDHPQLVELGQTPGDEVCEMVERGKLLTV